MGKFGTFFDSGHEIPPLECVGDFTSVGPVISQDPAERQRLMNMAMQPTDPEVTKVALQNLRAQRYWEIVSWILEQ